MITELLGLAGSGIVGSVFGIFSDVLQSKGELKNKELELKLRQESRLNKQSYDHIKENINKPAFRGAFFLLCSTYCLCTIICFIWPEVPVFTFNPDDAPRTYSILGIFTWSRTISHVYTISSGGIGFSLLHPLAFMIGSVITGVNPSKR